MGQRSSADKAGLFTRSAAAIAVAFLLLPITVVILISFSGSRFLEFPPPAYSMRWYESALNDSTWREALLLSIEVATIVAFLATVLGSMAAYGFVRGRFLGKTTLMALALSPMVVPGVVTAVGAYLLFAPIGLIETRTALVLTHTALALPVALLSVMSSLSTVNESLEHAARTLGAGPWETARRVTLPLIRRGLVTGALFAFITSFDEPVVSLFLAGTQIVTLPKRMWDGIQYEIDPTAAAVSTMLVAFVTAIVWIAGRLLRNEQAAGRQDEVRVDYNRR